MKSKVKKVGLIVVFLVIGVIFISNYKINKNDIEVILKNEAYSYLPVEAKDYVKQVYEETGTLILTEKNKKENEPYLNPEYVEYLKRGKASEYGYIPEEFTNEHSYQGDHLLEKYENSEPENIEAQPYYNLRDNGYITNVYDQGSEGLCWAFASSTSLESHIAIKTNKATMPTFSEKQVDYATTSSASAIDAGINPFYNEDLSILGLKLNEGGNMLRFNNSTAIGISPVLCRGNCSNNVKYNSDNSITDNMYWKHDYSVNSTLSPYEVFNIENTQYSVNESLFFNSLVSDDAEEVNSLVQILKNQIVNNGSLYVGVGAYTNLSIEYTPTDGERVLNSNGKNLIYYIPTGWNPASGLNHAVSIIGWDDNYTHNVCLNKTDFVITDAKKNGSGYYCSSTKETLHTINGAWILQNSWGVNNDTYIYLPYNSMKSSYSSISEVGDVDFDNSYRAYAWRSYFDKGTTKEALNKIKIFVSSYNQTINVYYDEDDHQEIIINDGSKSTYATLLKSIKTTYPGLYTIDLSDKNIVYDETLDEIWFRFDTNDSDYNYYASLHTNNVDDTDKYIKLTGISKTDDSVLEKCNLSDNKCISKPEEVIFDNDNNAYIIKGITRNLSSSDNLTFTILNNNGEDVTDLFHVFRNFSVSNYINALISYNNDEVSLETYTIKVYYNGEYYNELEWNLTKHNNTMSGIGTEKNPYVIKTVSDLNDLRNQDTKGNYYALNNDLDLSYDTTNSKGLYYNSGAGWLPIDDFYGSFDGNNHVISGLYINRPKSVSEDPVGVFEKIYGTNNYIKNLIIKDVNINGNLDAGALSGMVSVTDRIEINNISVVGGKVNSSYYNGGLIGGITNTRGVNENINCNMYNLYSNVIVGNTSTTFAGGIIGVVESSGNILSTTINDSVSFSKVSGNGSSGYSAIGGIIGDASYSNNLIINNVISAGSYKTQATTRLGDVVGIIHHTNSVNITGVWHTSINKLNGSLSENGAQTINNNTTVTFDDVITHKYTNYFEHKTQWSQPEINGIKRLPMLTTLLDKFDFTETIDDFELKVSGTKNIYDLITPSTDSAKNIEWTYDDEYLTISPAGIITPKKEGVTTIHITSLYDGYKDDIQVTIAQMSTITFNSNSTASETTSQEVAINRDFNLAKNTFTYKGHTFKNWNTKADGSGDTYTDEQLIEGGISQDLTLYAQWIPIRYTIHFDGNGGIYGADKTSYDFELDYPETGKLGLGDAGFKRDNYSIDNWNTKADGTGIKFPADLETSIIFDEIPFDENYEVILYAQWKKVEYKVYFDSNGGNETMTYQLYEFDETKALNLNTFTKTGHTFKNWNTKADGSGDTYTDGQEIRLPKNNLILYAQWTPNKQIVSFDPNGGTGTMENQDFYYNVSQGLHKNTFTKEHYVFLEWNTKADGTGISYTDGKSIKITKNVTLYAQWKPDEYTIEFVPNGGTGTMGNQKIAYGSSVKLNSVGYTKIGYTFKNWNTKSDGTGTSYSDTQEISLDGHITLYAIWQEGPAYTIKEYSVDEDNMYIDLIPYDTTVDEFKHNIVLNPGYSIEVDYKTANNKNVLYTGGKTKILQGQEVIYEFTNIVTGDVNGDGKISSADYVKIRKHIMQTEIISNNIIFKAADITKDNKISSADYVKIRKYIMEKVG